MRVIWDGAPMTANQVVDALDGQADWKPKTIHTLLKRLAQKGALGFERSGREYVYHPLVDAQDCMQAASQSFLERVFDGNMAPFLACFVEQESLSDREIDELKRILEEGRK
jgi:BlaI family penicillinase repressor